MMRTIRLRRVGELRARVWGCHGLLVLFSNAAPPVLTISVWVADGWLYDKGVADLRR